MRNRIEIEEAENGYSIRTWSEKDKEEMEDDYGYQEPKTFVASTEEEVLSIIKKTFNKEK